MDGNKICVSIVLKLKLIHSQFNLAVMYIQIRNQFFSIYQIESFITPAVLDETETYKKEGNCWPDLWVKDCIHLSVNEQIAFIYLATYGKNGIK